MMDGPDPLSRRTLLSYQQDLTGREEVLTVCSTFRRMQPLGDLGLEPAAEPWAIEIMMALLYGAIELSVLFFYRRLFVVNRNTLFDIVTEVAIVVATLWTIAFFFLTIYCGIHIDAIWENVIRAAEVCPDGLNAGIAFWASDFGTDALVLVLPLPTV